MDSQSVFEMTCQEQQEYLCRLVELHKGEAYREITKAVADRIDFELREIEKQGIAIEFLVAMEIKEILSENDARYPHCIGTGAGSIISYILGITDVALEPISHGLIFERGFSVNHGIGFHFTFYADDCEQQALLEELSECYNDVSSGVDLLKVNGKTFILHNHLEIYDLEDITRVSKIAIFAEDYMHLLHYIAGYSYEEANRIRMLSAGIRIMSAKTSTEELRQYRLDFVFRCKDRFDEEKAEELFDSIIVELRYARTKAYVLSVMSIIRKIDEKIYDDFFTINNFGQWYEKKIIPLLNNQSFIALVNDFFGLCYQWLLKPNLSVEKQEKYVWRCYLYNSSIGTLLEMAYEIFTFGTIKNLGKKLILLDNAYYKPILGYLLNKEYIE